ncbi:leucyl/phenylalanyl-tRNA--protein transferase [Leekyejoonella antrihumi]|uniref:Leucyl/phenylalanyl-tRNA--protein transferase n=1 Tax=Leekyejoonella antrihumi TaxID=1660198 RepID=A0A563E430_9MICO|nr:leucyl/phenylalanyl-tRNA--protein transferase [Leekyejoonella antrihumi]TWP37003.1 leucyl/phenylalanyl-tRNA--protein transferase [Leekyejoonella antrihumi]
MPIEPSPTSWDLGGADLAQPQDLLGVGADLEPGTLLSAYRHGLFPMGTGPGGHPPMGWWCPQRRGVLLPGDHHVQRSLRRARRRFTVSVDHDFAAVIAACADPAREGRWITTEVTRAYTRLHELGWAHSIEVWDDRDALAGGLYGLCIGGLFAGESMFHHATDASKVALWALVEIVFADCDTRRMIDVQWQTPHLQRQGVREIPRATYLRRLPEALAAPEPATLHTA